MNLLEAVPLRELCVELFLTGQSDKCCDGWLHCKTCPHTILAQAVQGHYEIACGDGRTARLAEGEAWLTGANLALRIWHFGDAARVMRIRWIHLHCTLFGALDACSLLDLPLQVSRAACEPFGEIIAANQAGSEDFAPDSLGALARRQELAWRALRLLCELAPMRPGAGELLRERHRLEPVLRHMEQALAEKISVAELARLASLSVPRFHVFFRQNMGRSPMAHLRHLRLAEASRLLATGNEPLRVVAERTGFCNEFHLSREFRAVFGKAPGIWRREYDRNLA